MFKMIGEVFLEEKANVFKEFIYAVKTVAKIDKAFIYQKYSMLF